MNYYAKKNIFSKINNGYKESITMVLHNGVINENGFLSITMSKHITEFTNGITYAYKNLKALLKDIKENKYVFNQEEILTKYKSLKKIKKNKLLKNGKNRNSSKREYEIINNKLFLKIN